MRYIRAFNRYYSLTDPAWRKVAEEGAQSGAFELEGPGVRELRSRPRLAHAAVRLLRWTKDDFAREVRTFAATKENASTEKVEAR